MKIRNTRQVKKHMKDMNMKRLFRRNQIIVTTLAVMIIAAGYLNYAGKKDLVNGNTVYEAEAMDVSDEGILVGNQAASLIGQSGLQEIPSLDQDPSDLDAVSDTDGAQAAAGPGMDTGASAQTGNDAAIEEATQAVGAGQTTGTGQMARTGTGSSAQTGLEDPGEAALTSGMSMADHITNVQLSREQARVKNKGTLMTLINSISIDKTVKQQTIQDMIKLTGVSGKENAVETLLVAKDSPDPMMNIIQDEVDVVIDVPSIADPQCVQTEDIIKREAEVGADQIIITLLDTAE